MLLFAIGAAFWSRGQYLPTEAPPPCSGSYFAHIVSIGKVRLYKPMLDPMYLPY